MTAEGGGASETTEPARGSSTATDVSLRTYLTALISAAEQRSDARFDAMKEMVETAFDTAKEAITKAEEANEKRFSSVNEFRAVLSDQAAQFVTRRTLDALIDKLETEIERNREDLDGLAKRIDVREGEIKGSRLTYGNMAALIATAATVVSIVIVLSAVLGH